MVSKPNPNGDEEIRFRLYNVYQRQMPMWDHPGDFNVGRPLMDTMYTGNGCMNCNTAFKLGSGRLQNYSYNAYDAPSQFFYLPNKLESYGQNIPKGGNRYQRRKPKPRSRYDNYDFQKRKEEAELDWYGLVKELVPMGFKIADIVKIFYDKYAGKYGGDMINDLLNLDVKAYEKISQQLGEHQYF